MQADAPCVADDDGADLQKLQADRAGLGAGRVGALEREAADRLDQAVGQRRQDQPELVGPPIVTGGAVGEQVDSSAFDPI